ncbi:MAG TPA: sensor histidine kinase [Candidatus Dormibacteraeota bacterium]|nr:sensor histidine kinase [Candidatus Dormibacteraeota bacterium]
MSDQAPSPRWDWRRFVGANAWIVLLASLLADIIDGRARPTAVAGAILAGFAALWVCLVSSVFARRLNLAIACLGGMASLALLAALWYPSDWQLLFVFIAAACGVALPQRPWAVAGVGVAVLAAAAAAVWRPGQSIGMVVSTASAGWVSIYFTRQRLLVNELRESREELARLAVSEERLRFARDLHDLLGHTLSLMVVKTEAVRRLIERDPGAAVQQAHEVEAVGRRALAEVRDAVTGYRQHGLTSELDSARSALADVGIETTIKRTFDAVTEPADQLLGWAVREGVTNVIRHSQARHCEIVLRKDQGWVTVEIQDDGVGPQAAQARAGGSGLTGLRERLARAGGRVEFGGRADRGFHLIAAVPTSPGPTPP